MLRWLLAVLLAGLALSVMVGCVGAYGSTPAAKPSVSAEPAIPTKQPATAPTGSSVPSSGEVDVLIQDFGFSPGTQTVSLGTTIRWTQKDAASHTVTSDKGVFESGSMSQGKVFTHTFSVAGTFEYHCSIHPSMKGMIVVQ